MSDATWTTYRLRQLVDLYDAGISCTKIASIIGAGLTRNAIVDKLNAMGVACREKRVEMEPKPSKYRPPKPPHINRISLRPISKSA